MGRDAARTIDGNPKVPTARPVAPAPATNDRQDRELPVNTVRFMTTSPKGPENDRAGC